ncbi:MAG TPA: Do family serine endopeptidase [Longimicrobiales bacterium]|nr:Do family serine endopeptidase [Longimicrobiales bacterium]
MSSFTRKRAAVGSLAVVVSALAGAALHAGFVTTEHAFAADASTPVAAPMASRSSAETFSNSFADLAEQVTPSVVQIEVVLSPDAADPTDAQIPDEFRRFFDMPFGGPGPSTDQPRMGGGSGFLVSDDGYIVTNNHVVGDADRITVTLNDHRAYTAEVVGTDPTTDVAVIKIDAKDLPHLAWGSSDHLRVGEWVMAVGNPGFGDGQLDYTVTTGIVSAKGRPLQLIARDLQSDPRYGTALSGYAIENFIQTDAVINPGNSGGPMVNLEGQVVGMNSAIASTDGHYQGYGFAIPSDLVHKVTTDLMENGHVLRPWLGVQVTEVGPEDAEVYHLPSVSGVLIQGVTEGSPADKAGIKQGDVLVGVEDQAVTSGGELQELIAVRDQGEKVTLRYYRDGKELQADVRLGEAPVGATAAASRPGKHEKSASAERLGIAVQPMSEQIARQLGFKQAEGVVVSDVDATGPAAGRGIVPGLRITKIGRTEVHNPQDVAAAIADTSAGSVVTLVLEDPAGATRIANVRAR